MNSSSGGPGPHELTVTALICDAAQVADGKLYILGGGWSYAWAQEPGAPTPMALAVQLAIPWGLANRRLEVEAKLVTEDSEQVTQDFGEVRVTGVIEAGRPPGARPGAPLVVPFVVQYAGLQLGYGGYVWEVAIDGRTAARVPFQVAERPTAP